MRTPSNEALAERSCVLTRAKGERAALIRLALAPDGRVLPDVRARAPGRGAWLAVGKDEVARAVAKGRLLAALRRAFRTEQVTIDPALADEIEAALRTDALNRLGLEARAGHLLLGTDRIAETARAGRLRLLLHAADAAADGRARLAQAWRVGLDEEGSGRQGLVLAADRPMLAAALGRENAVHLGVADDGAAHRVAQAVDRWHNYVGLGLTGFERRRESAGETGGRQAALVKV